MPKIQFEKNVDLVNDNKSETYKHLEEAMALLHEQMISKSGSNDICKPSPNYN